VRCPFTVSTLPPRRMRITQSNGRCKDVAFPGWSVGLALFTHGMLWSEHQLMTADMVHVTAGTVHVTILTPGRHLGLAQP
jgi:hypothetical protein